MTTVRDRLESAGFALPAAPPVLGIYVPASAVGGMVFTAGQLPIRDGELVAVGSVGADVDVDTARDCATIAALNAIAAAATACDIEDVVSVAQLVGYVASAEGFYDQPSVVDGASEVLLAAFGENTGRHSRLAVGVAALPRGAPVEIALVLGFDHGH